MSGWIQLADITLASGRRSSFKIECDDLTNEEVSAMCALLVKVLPPFGAVSGVPTGGYRLEKAMAPYITTGPLLIIDDVWTTGGSMRSYRDRFAKYLDHQIIMAVLFARGPIPAQVTALFTLDDRLWQS